MFEKKKNSPITKILTFLLFATFFTALFSYKRDIKIIEYSGVYEKLYNNQKIIAMFFSLLIAFIGSRIFYKQEEIILRFIMLFMSGMIFTPVYISVVGDYVVKSMVENEKGSLTSAKVIVYDNYKHKSRSGTECTISLKNNNLDFIIDINEELYDEIKKNDSLNINYYLLKGGTKYLNKKNVFN